MALDVKQYLSELAKTAGVADDKLQAALEVIGNEKVSKAFSDGFMRQDEFSRSMDTLTKKEKELTNWYQEQLRVAQNNEKVVAETAGKLNQYRELYGEIDGGATPGNRGPVDTSQFISKKEFEEAQQKLGQQFIAVTKTATKCSADYMKRFGEVLDMDALEKFTMDSGLPLHAAYDKFIEGRVKDIESKSWEEKLQKAKDEGRQEGLSQRVNPTNPGSPAPNGFLANLKAKAGSTTLREGFVEEFQKAATK